MSTKECHFIQFKHTVKWREVSDNVLDCCHLASSEFNFRFQRRGQMLNLERRQIPNFTFITVLQKPIFTLLRAATILENCQFIEQIYYNKSKKLLVPFCFLFHSSVCLFVWIICCHIKKTIKADGKMVMAIFKSSDIFTFGVTFSQRELSSVYWHSHIHTNVVKNEFFGEFQIEHWTLLKYMYSIKDKSILIIKTLIINTLKMFH